MRKLLLLCIVALALAGCRARTTTTVINRPVNLPPQLQNLDAVLASAQQYPCAQNLHPIPATVIDVGVFKDVPYQSFSNGQVEVNAYGDPSDLVGLEAGTQVQDPSLQQCLITFIAAQALSPQEQARAARFTPAPALETMNGLTVEVTPPNAPDAYGAWWISLERPQAIANAMMGGQEQEQVVVQQTQWVAPPPPRYYVGPPVVRYRPYRPVGPRVYVPRFHRPRGVYLRIR